MARKGPADVRDPPHRYPRNVTDAAPRPLWRRIGGSVWFHLLAAFVVFGLLLTFVAKPYVVPSASMIQWAETSAAGSHSRARAEE